MGQAKWAVKVGQTKWGGEAGWTEQAGEASSTGQVKELGLDGWAGDKLYGKSKMESWNEWERQPLEEWECEDIEELPAAEQDAMKHYNSIHIASQ